MTKYYKPIYTSNLYNKTVTYLKSYSQELSLHSNKNIEPKHAFFDVKVTKLK